MKNELSSAEQMRQLINEIGDMSRRKFLKGIGGSAVSAVVNPKIGIGNLGSGDTSPQNIGDRKKLAGYIVNFLKNHKDEGKNHPAYNHLLDYSKRTINKLKSEWEPSKEDLAKIYLKQDSLIRDLYGKGVEDPDLTWIYDQETFFGFDGDDLFDEVGKVQEVLYQISKNTTTSKMKIKKRRSEYYKKITDRYAEMLNSDDDVSATFEKMDEDLRDAILKVLDEQKKDIKTISAEELKIILSRMSFDRDSGWVYNEEDEETYEYNPAENAYLDVDNDYTANDMFDFLSIPYEPEEFDEPNNDPNDQDQIDVEPTQSVNTQLDPLKNKNNDTEPESDDDDDDNNDNDKKFKSAQESIRYYIEMVEKINKR